MRRTTSSWCRLGYTRYLELHWSMSNKSSKSSNFSHTKLFTKRLENWSIRSGSVRCQPINRQPSLDYQQQKTMVIGYFFLQKHPFSSQPTSSLFPHFHTRFSATRFILAIINDYEVYEVYFDRYRPRRYPQIWIFLSEFRLGSPSPTPPPFFLSLLVPLPFPFFVLKLTQPNNRSLKCKTRLHVKFWSQIN
jgi:hypothetical protein